MQPIGKFVRACAAAVAFSMLSACGGVGGVGPASGNGQVGGGGGGSAPTIEGAPRASVAVGRAYSFLPAAQDADGGSLTFSAQNLPAWLTLDAASGRLSGTPAQADIGTYAGITIRVSDGASSSTLGPFTITVVAAGNGTASLRWMPPTTNTDGSVLLDLAGFVILYGFSPDQLTETVTINDPAATSYILEELTSGTWYFAVQATNSHGVLSNLSSVASKTIG